MIVLSLVVLVAIAGAVAAVPLGSGSDDSAGSGNQGSANEDSDQQGDAVDEVAEHDDQTDPGIVRQDPDTVPAPDNAILAAETGLPLAEIDSALAFQEAFAEYAEGLLIQFPDQISAVWMDSPSGTAGPSTRGHIRFTGEVPGQVTDMKNVVLTGGGLISIADQSRRAEIAAQVLVDLGYTEFATFFSPSENTINLELLLPEESPEPSKSDLVTVLQQNVQLAEEFQGRANQVLETDVALTVLRGSGPFVTLHHSRGGNWLLDDGDRECTSGWSVSGPNGDGVLSAGHCSGLNQFEQPGVTPYSMTYRSQVFGPDGDVEYHTTSHVELAEFYATAANIRDVTGIKATDTMVGGTVCFYGRASDSRTCSIKVEAVNANVLAWGHTLVGNLARTDDTPSIGGDSGGGWSFNYTAWGIEHGPDVNGKGYFTPVEEAQDALNVTIKTQ